MLIVPDSFPTVTFPLYATEKSKLSPVYMNMLKSGMIS